VDQKLEHRAKKQARRINLIPVFIGIVLLFATIISIDWYRTTSLNRQLQKNGVDVTAKIVSLQLRASGARYSVVDHDVSDPNQATGLNITVQYDVSGSSYLELIQTTFSQQRNDHMQVYQEALSGKIKVRYLATDPSKVRPAAELTDPANNPPFGGK
jgi:hypothetical protein